MPILFLLLAFQSALGQLLAVDFKTIVGVELYQQPPLSTEQIAEQILRATVTIVSFDHDGNINGTGSGFFVSPNSIITNHHVIDEAHSIKYRIQGSENLYDVTNRRSVDMVNDLALLETSSSSNNVIRLSNNGVRIGQTIYVAGAPRMLESTFSNGIVSALRSESGMEWIQITAPISAGSSGGPVVDSKAELVGVTVGTIRDGQNLNFAVPTKYVQNLIQTPLTVASTPDTPNRSSSCGDMMMDQDGNRYKTVLIGSQCWMAENLRTSKYRDGSTIPNVTGNSQWGSLTTGAWATYENSAANNATYGKLYNWYAVADRRNICPVGWHVPSDAEWTMLSTHLGTDPGHKMKSTSSWLNNGNGSNTSGFTALPGGSRFEDGGFSALMSGGYFWSSNEIGSDLALYRMLGYGHTRVDKIYYYKVRGFSVRCLRD